MAKWEEEFKKYIATKVKKKIGIEINPSDIKGFYINTDIDLSQLKINDLALIYAFAIMSEDFEYAKNIADELEIRDCDVKIDTDEQKRIGAINIYKRPDLIKPYTDIKMKVLPDGMIIDFEKQNI